MRVEVRYFTRNGGTKKLADAIAAAMGVEARTVDQPLEKFADVVFLGASVYGGKPHAAIKSAAAGSAVKTAEMFFQCRGQFLFFNKNRPNDQDCADAAEFARKQLKILSVT